MPYSRLFITQKILSEDFSRHFGHSEISMCQGNTIKPVRVIIGEFFDYLAILSDLSS